MARSLYSRSEHIKNYRIARAMLNILKTPLNHSNRGAARRTAPHVAGHGVDRPVSPAAAATLPLDRRTRALRARPTGSSAGHGVHRSNSPTASRRPIPPRTPAASVFIRAHPCASMSPLPLLSAGHGVHRSISQSSVGAPPWGRPHGGNNGRSTAGSAIGVHRRSSAVSTPSSAGHGVHRSILETPPSEGARPP